jgi:hypothetical protein
VFKSAPRDSLKVAATVDRKEAGHGFWSFSSSDEISKIS